MPIGTFSAIPTPETTLGIAKETTRGTAVTPSYFLPVMAPKYKPDRQYLSDESLQGSMVQVYDMIPGLRYDSHDWEQYLYLDSFPLLVQAELGSSDTFTAAAAATTLSAAAAAGSTTIQTTAALTAGAFFTMGTQAAGTLESHKVLSVAGSTATLVTPVVNNQANGATVTPLNTHKFSLLNNSPTTGNQPPSFTITDYAGETQARQLTAAQLDGLNISGSAESLPKATVNWFANPAVNVANPSSSFTGAESPAGWTANLSIGGTAVPYVVSWEVDMKRNVKAVPAITGTQNYWQYFASMLDASMKITVLEDMASTWLNVFENGTQETMDLTVYDVQSGWCINFHNSKAKFTTGELDRSKEWLEVPLDVALLPNSTDALAGGVSPIEITVANAVATTY